MTVQEYYSFDLFQMHETKDTDNGYAVYPSSDKCIFADATNDYPAFCDLAIDPNDETLLLAFYDGTSHNGDTNGNIAFLSSSDLGTTWSAKSVVVANGGRLLTNPSCAIDANGRWYIFFGYQPTGERYTHLVYSDDQGSSWSSEINLTNDYAGGQITGPSSPIIQGEYIYKAFYAAQSGEGDRRGIIYRCHISDPTTWALWTQIYNLDSFDGEEPSIVKLSDNSWLFLVRSDPDQTTYFVWSPNKGQTNSRIVQAFDSIGKNPVAITANGTIWGLGRSAEPGGRAIFWYSSDNGNTFTYSNIDERESGSTYMYAGAVQIPSTGKGLSVRSIETIDSTVFSGPCVLIQTEFTESLTPVSPPPVYDEHYQGHFDYVQGLGFSVENAGRKELISQLITDLKSDGIWDGVAAMWLFLLNNASLGAKSLYKIKMPWQNIATLINDPPYGVDGYDFNGTDQAINLNWEPNSSSIYQLNNAGLFISVRENIAEDKRVIGVSTAAAATIANCVGINPRSSAGNFAYNINDNTATSFAIADGSGRFFIQRTDASTKRAWRNGTMINSASVASTNKATAPVYVGASNFSGGPSLFSSRKVGTVIFTDSQSGNESQLDSRISAFETAILAL